MTLKDALDGLQTAEQYAEQIDANDLANEIARCYQRMGRVAPSSEWDNNTR